MLSSTSSPAADAKAKKIQVLPLEIKPVSQSTRNPTTRSLSVAQPPSSPAAASSGGNVPVSPQARPSSHSLQSMESASSSFVSDFIFRSDRRRQLHIYPVIRSIQVKHRDLIIFRLLGPQNRTARAFEEITRNVWVLRILVGLYVFCNLSMVWYMLLEMGLGETLGYAENGRYAFSLIISLLGSATVIVVLLALNASLVLLHLQDFEFVFTLMAFIAFMTIYAAYFTYLEGAHNLHCVFIPLLFFGSLMAFLVDAAPIARRRYVLLMTRFNALTTFFVVVVWGTVMPSLSVKEMVGEGQLTNFGMHNVIDAGIAISAAPLVILVRVTLFSFDKGAEQCLFLATDIQQREYLERFMSGGKLIDWQEVQPGRIVGKRNATSSKTASTKKPQLSKAPSGERNNLERMERTLPISEETGKAAAGQEKVRSVKAARAGGGKGAAGKGITLADDGRERQWALKARELVVKTTSSGTTAKEKGRAGSDDCFSYEIVPAAKIEGVHEISRGTVAHALMSRARTERYFKAIYKYPRVFSLCIVLGELLSAVLAAIALVTRSERERRVTAILSVVFRTVSLPLFMDLSVVVVKKIFRCFHFWFLAGEIAFFNLVFCFAMGGDIRCLLVITMGISMLYGLVFDAAPKKLKRLLSIAMAAALFLEVWVLVLFNLEGVVPEANFVPFSIAPPEWAMRHKHLEEDHEEETEDAIAAELLEHNSDVGRHEALNFALGCLLTISLFTAKNIWHAWRSTTMVMLTGGLKIKRPQG